MVRSDCASFLSAAQRPAHMLCTAQPLRVDAICWYTCYCRCCLQVLLGLLAMLQHLRLLQCLSANLQAVCETKPTFQIGANCRLGSQAIELPFLLTSLLCDMVVRDRAVQFIAACHKYLLFLPDCRPVLPNTNVPSYQLASSQRGAELDLNRSTAQCRDSNDASVTHQRWEALAGS